MNMFVTGAILLTVVGACGPALAQHADIAQSASFKGHELSGAAKITLARARDTALAARPGNLTDQELEKEAGGSGLRYSFDINSGGHAYEVGVDAVTGRVMQNTLEGSKPD